MPIQERLRTLGFWAALWQGATYDILEYLKTLLSPQLSSASKDLRSTYQQAVKLPIFALSVIKIRHGFGHILEEAVRTFENKHVREVMLTPKRCRSMTQLSIFIQTFSLIAIFFEGYDQGVMGGVCNTSSTFDVHQCLTRATIGECQS